jgi:NAD(P)-dependent dehydrogenase (short-subunit alcohol dehydrogenase family)
MYGASKLANVIHAYELQRRLRSEGSDIVVTPVTPGFVSTELFSSARNAAKAPPFLPLTVSCERGAETSLHAALAAPAPPGTWCLPYFAPVRVGWLRFLPVVAEGLQKLSWGPRFATTAPETYDTKLAGELWAFAEQAVGLAR